MASYLPTSRGVSLCIFRIYASSSSGIILSICAITPDSSSALLSRSATEYVFPVLEWAMMIAFLSLMKILLLEKFLHKRIILHLWRIFHFRQLSRKKEVKTCMIIAPPGQYFIDYKIFHIYILTKPYMMYTIKQIKK